MVHDNEIQALRALAARWMAHAADPVMVERRRQWRAIKDLKMEKPMILMETCMLSDYIGPDELVCQDPYLRGHREDRCSRWCATPTKSATTSS